MKFHIYLPITAALTVMLAASSCSDDATPTPLEPSSGVEGSATFNSLTFEWEKVEGATQYGYQLFSDSDQALETDVTNQCSATFTGLQPATDYRLVVRAFAPMGCGFTTSKEFEIHGRTADLTVLESPRPVFEQQNNDAVFTWEPVENAESYVYTLSMPDGTEIESSSTTACSLKISGLATDTYNFSLQACTSAEGYKDSEVESISFEFEYHHNEIWRATGEYTSSILNENWEATIIAYDDNTFELLGWYGVSDFNLNFGIDKSQPDNEFYIPDDFGYTYDDQSYTYYVLTGRSQSPTKVSVYPWNNFSSFTGDANKGKVTLCVWNKQANDYTYDEFVWANEGAADQFIGEWTMTMSGQTMITADWSWQDYDDTVDIEIKKVNANTISMPAPYFTDETVEATIDLTAGTITIQPKAVWTYYTFSGEASATNPVVGTINADGSITIDNYSAWYDGYYYLYDTKAKLVRK